MSQAQWTAVDDYLAGLFVPPDPALDAALQAQSDAGLPAIQVAPTQGKLLAILAKLVNARSILEIGTLGGYSTIWLARTLPANGQLVTLEYERKHADVARANLTRAGLIDKVELRVGPALETLPQLDAANYGPFDFVFIDADKVNTPGYFAWALKLTRRGSLIVVDNVIRSGEVIDPNSNDPSIQGIRRFNEMLAAETRVTTTSIQTVGSKGYDGLAIILVTQD